jgi:predicted HicB family RNase H-like nuclease
MENDIKPTSIRIPAELKAKLEQMAKEDGRSFNNLVNKILNEAAKQGETK